VPSDIDAVIVPESEAVLPFQLNVTGSAPEGVAPVPAPIVAQPVAPSAATTSGNAILAIRRVMSYLLLHPASGIAARFHISLRGLDFVSTASMIV
jgi:hypothetical protein